MKCSMTPLHNTARSSRQTKMHRTGSARNRVRGLIRVRWSVSLRLTSQYTSKYQEYLFRTFPEELEDYMEPELTNTVQNTFLRVEKKPLKSVRSNSSEHCGQRTVIVCHTKMCGIGVHFRRNGWTARDSLATFHYWIGGYVSSTDLCCKDTTGSIHRVRPEVIVYKSRRWNRKKSVMLRPVQK